MLRAADLVFTNKDLVERYAKFRPSPPPDLIDTVVQRVMGEGGKVGDGLGEKEGERDYYYYYY